MFFSKSIPELGCKFVIEGPEELVNSVSQYHSLHDIRFVKTE